MQHHFNAWDDCTDIFAPFSPYRALLLRNCPTPLPFSLFRFSLRRTHPSSWKALWSPRPVPARKLWSSPRWLGQLSAITKRIRPWDWKIDLYLPTMLLFSSVRITGLWLKLKFGSSFRQLKKEILQNVWRTRHGRRNGEFTFQYPGPWKKSNSWSSAFSFFDPETNIFFSRTARVLTVKKEGHAKARIFARGANLAPPLKMDRPKILKLRSRR